MINPKNTNKSIEDLISDVQSQLINIEASMELAAIAASTTPADAASLGAFIDLMRPLISYAADQLEDISMMLNKDSQNEENA